MKSIQDLKLGCRKMFKPWGKSREESSWRCGDEWNN